MPLLSIAAALAQFAPDLLRYLGAGDKSTAVAQKMADVAQAVTGTATPQEALDALRANQAAQLEFQRRAQELGAQLEQAYLNDVADARKRDIAMLAAGKHNTRADVMVALDVLGLVVCLLILGFYRAAMPGEVVGLLSTIAGIFGLCLRDAHQFEFGTSRGSRDKDDLLWRQSQQRMGGNAGGNTGGGA